MTKKNLNSDPLPPSEPKGLRWLFGRISYQVSDLSSPEESERDLNLAWAGLRARGITPETMGEEDRATIKALTEKLEAEVREAQAASATAYEKYGFVPDAQNYQEALER